MKKRMWKSGILALLAAAGVTSLTGCQKKAEDTTIKLGVMYSSDIVPLAVIEGQKLDEKYGIDFEMEVFQSAKDRDAALQAGELDGVFTDYIGVCMYQNAGLDMKITGVTDGDYVLLAGKETDITDLSEAAGKSIAISENTLIEYSLDYILEQKGYGADYLKKEVVPRIPERLELLRTGSIDLGLLPDPFSTLAAESDAVILGSANEAGLYPAVMAFTKDAVSGKKDVIEKFYKAYNEAVDYVNTTPITEYEELVIERCGYPEELKGKIVLPEYRKDVLPSEEDLQNAINWAATKGLCPAELKPEDLLGKLD